VLEDANIKLGSVLSDVFGVSGPQRMLHALVEQPSVAVEELTALAHWSLKPKIEELKKALEGRVTAHHRFMIDLSLEHMQYIEKQILRLDKQIDQHIEPYRKQFELLQTIPGIGATASASVLAEMGPDTAPFDDDSKLASWAGICPGNNESAGKKFGTNTRKGNRYLVSTVVGMRLGFHPPERIPFQGEILPYSGETRPTTGHCRRRAHADAYDLSCS
jgi:transposase